MTTYNLFCEPVDSSPEGEKFKHLEPGFRLRIYQPGARSDNFLAAWVRTRWIQVNLVRKTFSKF